MANNGIPKGNSAWALVLGFSVAVAALFYSLWLISPRQLQKFVHKNPAPAQAPAAQY